MEAYQERVVDEKKDLDLKIDRLRGFIGSEAFNNISPAECKRMRRQELIMQLYSEVLADRIAAF